MRSIKMLLTALCVAFMAQAGVAQAHELPRPTGEEFQGMHQVLGVLGNTNVRRVDRDAVKTFQEYTDMKSSIYNRSSMPAASSAKSPNHPSPPRKINQRLF